MVNNKPTPAQAKLLKAVSQNGWYIDASIDRNGRCYRATLRDNGDWKLNKAVRPATFRACLRHGWVEEGTKDSWRNAFQLSTLGELILMELTEDDFIPDRPYVTTKDIIAVLRDKYRPPEWVFFDELRFGTGYQGMAMSRLDGWAISCWRSKHSVNYLKIAFEVKVYRSDFLKELKDPHKREPAFVVSNQYYFVTPKGMLMLSELPEDCGLMEVDEDGKIKTAKKAPTRKVDKPPWTFVASLGRRVQQEAEGRKAGPR